MKVLCESKPGRVLQSSALQDRSHVDEACYTSGRQAPKLDVGQTTIPVSAVVATRNRSMVLARTLESLLLQDVLPAELIVVDASADELSKTLVTEVAGQAGGMCVKWMAALESGAAVQRNQGIR